MTTLYVSPTGSGTRDGSSWANAGTISSLSSFITKAGANGEVLLRADQGAYKVTGQTTIRAGGEAGAPVTIRGVDATGKSMDAQFVGTRAADWTTGKPEGTEVFRLLAGADHLKFQNMAFENIGNGAFRIGADIRNLTLEHMQANNVRRFLEDTVSSGYASASVDGLTVRDVTIGKFSQNAIKLRYDSSNILIENVTGHGDLNTPEKYVQGIALDDTAHNVVFRNVAMHSSNARGSSTEYWNGDGFTTETGNYNIRFENTMASGNTDAGYDLKSSSTVLINTIAEGNNRNYRFWSTSISMEGGQSLDPRYFGGSASTDHFWLADGAHAKISGGSILDRNANVTVFDLWKTGAVLEVDGTTIDTMGKWSGLGSNSQVVIITPPAPEPAPSPVPQTITSTAGHDELHGTAGSDTIDGLGGNDALSGGGGSDRLTGGLGQDILSGGSGKDFFCFTATSESGSSKTVDTIKDFVIGEDKIDYSAIDASTKSTGNQSFVFIGDAKFSKVAGELRAFSVNGVTEVHGDVNGDGHVDICVKLSGALRLTAQDFIL
ncbi:calcium-binding protein [Microvirga zambiensis]|uniref:calcium-binding protein n=1 Tax=Microvirga zambiensis TaxID=1402137 RepID=UPI00191DC389|nr:M10 family metallopeptidase C-terminal domain-containing protein [Microvirga zambiensis]